MTDIHVVTLDTPSLGDRSYLVHDGSVAIVIDPQRDVDRFLAIAEEASVEITHVLETHVHNDYVSGGLELSRTTGATYALAASETVAFEREGLHDGDTVTSGAVGLRVVHTPGHTPGHLSFVLQHADRPVAAFTGGSLLYGAVGRPDLISADMTVQLAHAQYRSAQRIAGLLPAEAALHPTHGFGSHCATVTDDILRDGTLADERTRNPALTLSEDEFVATLLAGLHPYPAYYARMGPTNAEGPAPIDLSPPRLLAPDDVLAAINGEAWVVDLRTRRAYAAEHLRGSVNVELRDDLPTYLGWVLPGGTPIVLLAGSDADVAEAQRLLARVGIDDLLGAATGEPREWATDASFIADWPVAQWPDVKSARAEGRSMVVLDTREEWEFATGHHPAALNIPFYELPQRLGELPAGEVWIYCATGNRATVAASILANTGRDVVLIDDFCLPGDSPGDDGSVA